MPKAIFTPVSRDRLSIAEACPSATLVASADGEDQYAVGDCRVTCRYQIEPGDFVSRQVLGCHNAIRTGQLACEHREFALMLVARAETVIGIVGPERAAEEVVAALVTRFQGVVVSESGAIVV